MRVPSTAITVTRDPDGTNPPSETTSTNLSLNRTTPAGRSAVVVVPTAPSNSAASLAPGNSDSDASGWSVGGVNTSRFAPGTCGRNFAITNAITIAPII